MNLSIQEFSTEPVPEDRTVGWIRVAIISATASFSLPTLISGMKLANSVDTRTALTAIICGNLLLTIIGGFCGSIGSRTRLSSYMLTRIAFGSSGAAAVNIALAISLLGWFGVNIDILSGAVFRLLNEVFDINIANWIIEVIAGIVITVTTFFGFRAINILSLVVVPVLMVVTMLLVIKALGVQSIQEIFSTTISNNISFGDAMSSITGGVIIGAIILPDITRFIRNWQGAIYTAVFSYIIFGALVQLSGGLTSIAFLSDDILDTMIFIGMSGAAFAIVISGSWVLNSLNLYSSMLSFEATFPKLTSGLIIVPLGLLGTGAAFFNILEYFLDFLFYLAIVFTPVAGVIIVDYCLVRRSNYHEQPLNLDTHFVLPAIFSWVAGALISLLGSEDIISFTGIAALDAILVSGFVYFLITHIQKSSLLPRT